MFEKASSVPTAALLRTEGPGWEQPRKCALLLKRKMYLDSLPNTTSASLCTSVGEAEQQGGEDERSYQLTVWELLAHFLSDSCRWSLAWQDLPESPSATPVGEAQLWPPCGAWGGITPLAPQMGWQEGREACWALLNIFFPSVVSLFLLEFFLLSWWIYVGERWDRASQDGPWISCFFRCWKSPQLSRQVYLGLSDEVCGNWGCL